MLRSFFIGDERVADRDENDFVAVEKSTVENTPLSNQRYKYQGIDGFNGIIKENITIASLKELDKQLRKKKEC